MRKQKDETYQAWLERVNAQEYRIALNRISKGDDVELVMEEMSQRLLKKILHPLYENINNTYHSQYDRETEKINYEQNYLNKRNPAADHVDDNFFDNSKKI